MSVETIQPIPTTYQGVQFRSRLEARWAVVFDQLDVTWYYEYEGYQTSTGYYLPDFWLPDVYMRDRLMGGVFVEVKPDDYPECTHPQLEEVARGLGRGAVLAVGLPKYQDSGNDSRQVYEVFPDWDYAMMLMYCQRCDTVKFDFHEGSYYDCPRCKADIDYDCPTLYRAFTAAANYRFW